MVLVGAAILPHGGFIFGGDPNEEISACGEENSPVAAVLKEKLCTLYNACERAGDLVAEMAPDVVVLFTPHGLCLTSGSFAVCIADKAQGVVPWNKRRREVKLTLDMNLSLELLKFVQERDVKADGIITFGASDAPLKWGEVVPLWFVDRKLDSAKTKYIIIGFCSGDMADAMGKTLHEFVSSLKQRVAVVISADLAHTHKTDSTIPDLYLPDPGWGIKPTEIADEFDRACEMWGRGIPYREDIQNGLDDVEETRPWIANDCLPWLQKATEQDEVARSCGRVGFQVLHGVLEKEIEAGGNIKSHFLARGAPTYFGMMSVVFDVQGS